MRCFESPHTGKPEVWVGCGPASIRIYDPATRKEIAHIPDGNYVFITHMHTHTTRTHTHISPAISTRKVWVACGPASIRIYARVLMHMHTHHTHPHAHIASNKHTGKPGGVGGVRPKSNVIHAHILSHARTCNNVSYAEFINDICKHIYCISLSFSRSTWKENSTHASGGQSRGVDG